MRLNPLFMKGLSSEIKFVFFVRVVVVQLFNKTKAHNANNLL